MLALKNKVIPLVVSVLVVLSGCEKAPEVEKPSPQMRRMTEAQYRNTISDVFGSDISVVGRFEPEVRVDGLLAVGSSEASITTAGYERYYDMAKNIARQVVAKKVGPLATCDDNTAVDETCVKQFVAEYGKKLFRRPLNSDETTLWQDYAIDIAKQQQNGLKGAEFALSGMLISPEFLFIVDNIEALDDSDDVRLTAYSKAARLSYLLWNTTPDENLLAVADDNSIHNGDVLNAQIDRMINDERFKHGVEAFFSDFLQLERFDTLEKDKVIYPAFNEEVAEAAKEQILKLVTNHLVDENNSYLDLYTTTETWMNRPLGVLYAVPVRSPDGWEKFEFPKGDPRSGILSHIGFTALHSHPGRSSATLRGIAIRELLMCQPVAPAPAAVNFTVVQDTENPDFKTARERLTQHRTDEACAGCHKTIDPVGLALENFDGAGQFRTRENGALIDTSGEVDGFEFQDAVDLGEVMKKHPGTAACVVEKTGKYALGRSLNHSEFPWAKELAKDFSQSNYSIKDLFKEIASSDVFYNVRKPDVVAEQQTASL